MRRLIEKHRAVLLYGCFGVLTTIINTAAYHFLYEWAHLGNVPSIVVSWVVSVLFAFVTNRRYVFLGKDSGEKTLLYQLSTFFGFRLASGLIDLGLMYGAVDILALNPTLCKLGSNVIVIIINYVASKWVVFRKAP